MDALTRRLLNSNPFSVLSKTRRCFTDGISGHIPFSFVDLVIKAENIGYYDECAPKFNENKIIHITKHHFSSNQEQFTTSYDMASRSYFFVEYCLDNWNSKDQIYQEKKDNYGFCFSHNQKNFSVHDKMLLLFLSFMLLL